MQDFKESLQKEKRYLEKVIADAKENLIDVPAGRLRISKDKNKVRYYHKIGNGIERYVSKKNKILANQLAQKMYLEDVLKNAEEKLKWINKCQEIYMKKSFEDIYVDLHAERQELVNPYMKPWEQFVREWLGEEYDGKSFNENLPIIISEKGERVRSKSEKIIADHLYRRNIPYKYERPLFLQGFGIVYPDFTVLSRKTRREIYWEHEGMMDNPEYARTAVKKIELYQKNDIYPGDGLILTFETSQSMIDTRLMDGFIQKYLL